MNNIATMTPAQLDHLIELTRPRAEAFPDSKLLLEALEVIRERFYERPPGPPDPLAPNERKLLDAIEELSVKGVSPSYQELSDHLNWHSKGNVSNYVGRLIKKGWLAPKNGTHRFLRILHPLPGDK